MKYTVRETAQFRRDRRLCVRQGLAQEELDAVVLALAAGEELAPKFHDHALSDPWKGFRDCHIRPDWVLVYRIDGGALELVLTRTGTHSELFEK